MKDKNTLIGLELRLSTYINDFRNKSNKKFNDLNEKFIKEIWIEICVEMEKFKEDFFFSEYRFDKEESDYDYMLFEINKFLNSKK